MNVVCYKDALRWGVVCYERIWAIHEDA